MAVINDALFGNRTIDLSTYRDGDYVTVCVEVVTGGDTTTVHLDRDAACALLRDLAAAIEETWGGGPEGAQR